MADLPTKDEIQTLPLRAVLAFGLRCARRINVLNAEWSKDNLEGLRDIEWAMRVAHLYSGKRATLPDDYDSEHETAAGRVALKADHDAAYAAMYVLRATAYVALAANEKQAEYAFDTASAFIALTADVSAYGAGTAAQMASGDDEDYETAYDLATAAARQDFEKLHSLNLGDSKTLGQHVDASDAGPLGPIWPTTTPKWYSAHKAEHDELIRLMNTMQ